MLNDCNYNKVRLLHDLSSIVGYLERHAKEDAQKAEHHTCHDVCNNLQQDLEKHIEHLRAAIEETAKADDFQ